MANLSAYINYGISLNEANHLEEIDQQERDHF